MANEITKYDIDARYLYELNRQPNWEHWDRITRRERDYWRAQAQVFRGEDLKSSG